MYNEMTNYNKDKMQDLIFEIEKNTNQYNKLVNSLKEKINEMHGFWIEDPAAEKVYQELVMQFNKFKVQLDEGYDQMTRYKKQVADQVEKYSEAEQKTMNAI